MKTQLILFLVSVALSGCVSNKPVRSEFADEITQQGFASLQISRSSSSSISGQSWCSFMIESVSPKSSNTPIVTKDGIIAIEPGVNTLKVRVIDFAAIWNGNKQRSGITEITFLAAPRTAYTLCGFTTGGAANVWIAERNTLRNITGEFVVIMSPEVEEHYPFPIVVPIP